MNAFMEKYLGKLSNTRPIFLSSLTLAAIFALNTPNVQAAQDGSQVGTASTEAQVQVVNEVNNETDSLEEQAKVQSSGESNSEQGNADLETLDQEPGEKSSVNASKENTDYGVQAYDHMANLGQVIGSRPAGTEKEYTARDYIVSQLQAMGYHVDIQAFDFADKGEVKTSHNISALKAGEEDKEIILGAHYDSVTDGGSTGADDNASGVGVLLENAQRLYGVRTRYGIRFVSFGAEEVGLKGSQYYVDQMSPLQRDKTIAMINLDTLAAGDQAYVYSGIDDNTWVAETAWRLAEELGLNVATNPGLNPDYPAGKTGDWSDHAAFRQAGIPVAYFESTNWELGDKDGYVQTKVAGPIMHTEKDNLDFISQTFPGRIQSNLATHSELLYYLLLSLSQPLASEPTNEDLPSDGVVVVPPATANKGQADKTVNSLATNKKQDLDEGYHFDQSKVIDQIDHSKNLEKGTSIALPTTGGQWAVSGLFGLLIVGIGFALFRKR
ncbi:M28 family peptidase [Aerococcus kribbianus]|uniref:M28 family peptidase n=1 Tax=Aerococcus kribbianus TaxID=2999064 RepID=A0A9X3FVD9_9LACT|nr:MULTISPECIES: M28 family peptidase [unclassified Aerococcus]MCZ0716939.1 M28 family peptidase [Aerococcus sp. YH-aer221]MCZ0725227.1 M28 family peptidase [Aerococcus sp. YH-aer222]